MMEQSCMPSIHLPSFVLSFVWKVRHTCSCGITAHRCPRGARFTPYKVTGGVFRHGTAFDQLMFMLQPP